MWKAYMAADENRETVLGQGPESRMPRRGELVLVDAVVDPLEVVEVVWDLRGEENEVQVLLDLPKEG